MANDVLTEPNAFASALFEGLPSRYDRLGNLLSMGQDRRWRRAMLDVIDLHGGRVLDVATGTGGVAFDLRRRTGADVVGIDLTATMLAEAHANIARSTPGDVAFVQGRAEGLPFGDLTFDALTFTYLLRYVSDAEATLVELSRVVKMGATISSLEFAVPPRATWRALWWGYTRVILPLAGGFTGGREWYRAGRFLGPNISRFYGRHSLEAVVAMWERAGLGDVHVRRMSFGGGVVIWGTKAAHV